MQTATLTNTELVSSLYAAFGRGDIASIIEQVADDCVWVTPAEGILPQGGTYTGKEAVHFFENIMALMEFNMFEPQVILPAGGQEVVAYGRMTCTSRKTGKASTSDWAMRWQFNAEGKVKGFHDYYDTAAAYLAEQAC